jgi:arginine deiminase
VAEATKKLDKNYAKRQQSSLKYEKKRSEEKERLPSVYISKEQKEILGALRDKSGLNQGVLIVTGVNLLSALHTQGLDIKNLLDVGDGSETPQEKEVLVMLKIQSYVTHLLKS